MEERKITDRVLKAFASALLREEKSKLTVEKYLRDVRYFAAFSSGSVLKKALVSEYKTHLEKISLKEEKPQGVNLRLLYFADFLPHNINFLSVRVLCEDSLLTKEFSDSGLARQCKKGIKFLFQML